MKGIDLLWHITSKMALGLVPSNSAGLGLGVLYQAQEGMERVIAHASIKKYTKWGKRITLHINWSF